MPIGGGVHGEISDNYMDHVTRFNKTLGVGRNMDLVSRDYVYT